MKILNYLREKLLWLIGCDDKMLYFEKVFPFDCPICAYHRYGVMEGLTSGKVSPHVCTAEPDLQKMGDNAGTIACWNYAAALGPSFKERFEGLYEKCVELDEILRKKGAVGTIWIYGSKEFIDVLSKGHPRWILKANDKFDWKFECREFKQNNRILMGTKSNNYMHYARLYVANYPIIDLYRLEASYDDQMRY